MIVQMLFLFQVSTDSFADFSFTIRKPHHFGGAQVPDQGQVIRQVLDQSLALRRLAGAITAFKYD